ncbi:MAG TPA: nitroreductase family deazaflavin-dependent oxidoreductase [Dermatophilaceae bacterium]|nr:nitroreductase family deazaflavin-dependent oxidoreductase [Dermatophilaceae bacterium]
MTDPPTGSQGGDPSPARYVAPGGRTDRWSTAVVRWLTAHGVSVLGSRVLTVPGRRTGRPRSVPVNLLRLGPERYLLAPRGNTEWVRNVRAAGGATLRVGRRVEEVSLVEVPVGDRLPALRQYLRRWGWEVGRLVEGLNAASTDAELAAAAPGIPVFQVVTPSPGG